MESGDNSDTNNNETSAVSAISSSSATTAVSQITNEQVREWRASIKEDFNTGDATEYADGHALVGGSARVRRLQGGFRHAAATVGDNRHAVGSGTLPCEEEDGLPYPPLLACHPPPPDYGPGPGSVSTDSPVGSTPAGGSSRKKAGPTRCSLCGKKYWKAEDYQRHLVSHLDNKPFECQECGKRFQVKSNLHLHRKAAHVVPLVSGKGTNTGSPPQGISMETGQEHDMGQGSAADQDAAESMSSTSSRHKGPSSLLEEECVGTPQTSKGDVDENMNEEGLNGDELSYQSPEEGTTKRRKSETSSSPGSKKSPSGKCISPQSSSHGSGSRGKREDEEEDDEYEMQYPSMFPGLKQHLSIRNETVIVTRLEGITRATGETVALFKCHICGKIFNFLSKLQCHLSMHFERNLSIYVCMYCDAHFTFKTQLIQHLRRKHDVHLPPAADIPNATGDFGPMIGLDDSTELDPEFGMAPSFSPPLLGPAHVSHSSHSHVSLHTAASAAASSGSATTTTADSILPFSGDGNTGGYSASKSRRHSGHSGNNSDNKSNLSPSSMHTPTRQLVGKGIYDFVRGMYVCQFCHKGFDRLFSLHRHERVHTGFKPCYCKYCGRGFSEPRNLRHHVIRFHSDGTEIHSIKRLRKSPTDSSLTRTSQRLAYISPDMLSKASDSPRSGLGSSPGTVGGLVEEEGSVQGVSDDESMSSYPESAQTPMVTEPPRDSEKQMMNVPERVMEPCPTPERSNSPPLLSTTSSTELASEIREKEKLDDDITVVIPSDPIEMSTKDDPNLATPKSAASESTSWPGSGMADAESEPTSMDRSSEIQSAPIRSLMGHTNYKTSSRRKTIGSMFASAAMGSREDYERHKDVDGDVKPDMSQLMAAAAMAHAHAQAVTQAACAPPDLKPLQAMPGMSLSLPFNPLNISTYMTPACLPSLLHSPLVSPLSQAFFAQQGLTSPSMVGSLPFLNPLGAAVSSSMIATSPTGPTSTITTSPLSPSPTPAYSSSSASAAAAAADDRSQGSPDDSQRIWLGKGTSSPRGSSLSKSHSRLYVVRQPIKREDACKPIVLPDGRTVYRCSYCNKDFCTFSDVNRHMDFHEDIRPYKCKFCDYYARTNSQLKVHMMRHQGIREFHCKLCNYKGVTQSDLNRHTKSQIHMMKSQNECRHCGEGFVSPKNLERHYHEKHFSQYEEMASRIAHYEEMAKSARDHDN